MTDNPHRLYTASRGWTQINTCLACGAQTEGPLLPELPCPVPDDGADETEGA